MTNGKVLSIITINKDDVVGLGRTIRSLSKLRNSPLIEFLFVDGGSADESLSVAMSFYLSSEICVGRDRGIYDGMNKGLYKATGKFVIWINSGDEFDNTIDVDNLLEQLKFDYKNFDVISFSVNVRDESDQANSYRLVPRPSWLPYGMFPHLGMVCRTELVKALGGYDLRFKFCADRDLLVRLYCRGAKIFCDNRSIGIFYLGGVSSTNDLYLENCSIDYKNNLIGFYEFARKVSRYHLGNMKNVLMSFIGLRKWFR